MLLSTYLNSYWDFPGGPVVKTSPSNAGGAGLIPGQEAKIPYASQPKNQNIKQKQYCNKFNKDFKNGPHQKNFKKNVPIVLYFSQAVQMLTLFLSFILIRQCIDFIYIKNFSNCSSLHGTVDISVHFPNFLFPPPCQYLKSTSEYLRIQFKICIKYIFQKAFVGQFWSLKVCN